MEKAMVRYGVLNNDRKDTLFTFRDGDRIFFGIARCNLKAGDKFDRELGKKIATNRALKAKELSDKGQAPLYVSDIEQATFNIPFGSVPVTEVKNLLGYFHSLRTSAKL